MNVHHAISKGSYLNTPRQTLGSYLDEWLKNYVKPNLRPKTYYSYEQLIRNHLKPGLGKIQLDKLTPQHIETFLNDKRKESLSSRTVQYLRAVLRIALNRAVKFELLNRNVAALTTEPKTVKHLITPFTAEQAC